MESALVSRDRAGPPARSGRRHNVLPGFGLSLGWTLTYLSLIVLIPLAAMFARLWDMGWERFFRVVTAPQVMASYRVSFTTSLTAAAINVVFGLLVAWVLVRYRFPGKRLVDAIVDLPFALPTAVAGIALTQIYAPTGWLGKPLSEGRLRIPFTELVLDTHVHIQTAFSWLGITIALVFIGIPFVVRTVQPVLEDLDAQYEQAAWSLGATRWQTFYRVILPETMPALLTGFALAFARAFGEYGSVVFISGNLPFKTEIVPLMIYSKLEQYDYQGATAIATVMLVASFVLLLLINVLQRWASAYREV